MGYKFLLEALKTWKMPHPQSERLEKNAMESMQTTASKEASVALSNRDCRHGRQIGKCADCDLDHMEMAADAEARRVDELTALRKQDTELIRQMLESMCWAARVMTISEDEAPGYFAAIAAARARLEGKPCA